MRIDRNAVLWMMTAGLLGAALGAGVAAMPAALAQSPTGVDVKTLDLPPTGFFTSLVLAHGYKESKDAFQTDRYKPDRPATTFNADAESVFVVFDVLPRENPVHLHGQLLLAKGDGRAEDRLLYEEGVYLQTSQDSGFIEFVRPKEGWVPGDYKLKIHIGEKITDTSQLGTVRFRIAPSK